MGIIASAYFGYLWADGAASVAIGMLLVANAFAILIATRSLIAGESVVPAVLQDLWYAVRQQPGGNHVRNLATLHFGPSCILVAVTLEPGVGQSDRRIAFELEEALRAVDPRIIEVLFRFDR